ncbi:MFS transporter [Singulisphaera sp. PoT]|uniref:MFS transporter n=1 Tax=Singulisphaera sp. PoT TaxID=3411797 RepID=UPI003BF4DC6B
MSRQERVSPIYFALFASLYALQGVVVAYFFNFNQLYMIAAGVTEEHAAGIQSLALIPFILKFLGGPLSDRVNFFGFGHRKPYIILGLLVESLGLVGLAQLDPSRSSTSFTIVAILTVTGLALYDTCCDGMVIDITPPTDRSRVQGMLVAARAIAAMVCSLAFGYWLDIKGIPTVRYHQVLWACAALGLIPLALAVRCQEPSRASDAERFQWAALKVLILPRSLVLLAFGGLYSVVGYGVEINLSPYYQSLHFNKSEIGRLSSMRYVGRAVGAALLTLASRRFGRGLILAFGIVSLAATTAGQAYVGGFASATVQGFGFGLANGWDDAIFFVLAMEASDPRMAASTYALFMAVSNVSVAGGYLFSLMKSAFGGRYGSAFLVAAGLTLVSLALIPPLKRSPSKTAEPDDGVTIA